MHETRTKHFEPAMLIVKTYLHEEAEHGEHSEAAVLDLLDLQLSEGVGVVSQAQGVEVVTTGVDLVQALTGGAATHAVALDQAHQHNLNTPTLRSGLAQRSSDGAARTGTGKCTTVAAL